MEIFKTWIQTFYNINKLFHCSTYISMSTFKFKHEILKIRRLDSDQINVTPRELVNGLLELPVQRFDVLPGEMYRSCLLIELMETKRVCDSFIHWQGLAESRVWATNCSRSFPIALTTIMKQANFCFAYHTCTVLVNSKSVIVLHTGYLAKHHSCDNIYLQD